MITLKTNKLKLAMMMTWTTLLKFSGNLWQAGILLNLFPIKILLKQCKRLFQQRHKETIRIVKTCERNGCLLHDVAISCM